MKQNEDPNNVLRGLGQTKPREGMEARILARVAERRQGVRRANAADRFWRVSLLRRSAFALTAMAMALLVFSVAFARWRAAANRHAGVAELPTTASPVERTTATTIASQPTQGQPSTWHPAALYVRSKSLPLNVSLPQTPPLTEQEQLLLKLAATQKNSPSPKLGGMVLTEVVEGHGLGKNALIELSHQNFHPIHYTNPYTNPGETE